VASVDKYIYEKSGIASVNCVIVKLGERYSASFSFYVYRGRKEAIAAAKIWRNEILKRLGIPLKCSICHSATDYLGISPKFDESGNVIGFSISTGFSIPEHITVSESLSVEEAISLAIGIKNTIFRFHNENFRVTEADLKALIIKKQREHSRKHRPQKQSIRRKL